MNLLFDTIGKEAEKDEVDEIINNQLSRSIVMKYQLEKLEKSLNEQQIENLNEMLAWVVYMRRWPTVEELDIILRLQSKQKSSRPLEYQIKKLYGQVFEIEDTFVTAYSTMKYFEDLDERSQAERSNALSHLEGSTPSASSVKDIIPESEIALVQGIVSNMFTAHMFEKFGFSNTSLIYGLKTHSRIDSRSSVAIRTGI